VIEEALKQAPAETIFLYVGVGDRALYAILIILC